MEDKYFFTVDTSLTIRTWNSRMERLSHIQSGDVIGSSIKEVFPSLVEKISSALGNGKKKKLKNFKNTCFMGTDLCADVLIIPSKNKKGKVTEAQIVLENITGTCPLTKQLSESEKMIAIGKVASSLAHGVRNPLNAIKGAVVYLREKYGHESTLLEFSTIIYDEINRLDNFISAFLSTAKGEAKLFPVNINDILHSIFTMIRPRAEIQHIKIFHEFSDLPSFTADPFQIEQAIFNVINNALEAMPDGGIISVKTSLKWEGGDDYAVIEISDTGAGMTEKALHSLGELSDDPERNDRGFGIFLSREVIRAHGGKLLWESIRDRGTTFKIFLPVRQGGEKK